MGSIRVTSAIVGGIATSVRATDSSRAGLSLPLHLPLIESRPLPRRLFNVL